MKEILILKMVMMLIFQCKAKNIIFFVDVLFRCSDIYQAFFFHFRMDEGRQPLSRKIPIKSSKINPYRMLIVLRLVILGLFFHYRILHPVKDAYALWLISVICEIWFAVSWVLDQFPKWYPIERETYLDRLSLRYLHLVGYYTWKC